MLKAVRLGSLPCSNSSPFHSQPLRRGPLYGSFCRWRLCTAGRCRAGISIREVWLQRHGYQPLCPASEPSALLTLLFSPPRFGALHCSDVCLLPVSHFQTLNRLCTYYSGRNNLVWRPVAHAHVCQIGLLPSLGNCL